MQRATVNSKDETPVSNEYMCQVPMCCSDYFICVHASIPTTPYIHTHTYAYIHTGEKLVMHASAKGLFESWSFGLIVKRRYVLRDRMGEVGLGQLWSANDTQTGTVCVCKNVIHACICTYA